jgi:hypothetical protein
MSLDYDLTRIDHESVYWTQERTDVVTEAMIFLTMAHTVWDLTVEEAPECFSRIYAWERTRGAMIGLPDGKYRLITWPDVVGHIGLRTNAFPRLSRTAFVAKITRDMREGFLSTPDIRPPAAIRAEVRELMAAGLDIAHAAMVTVR